LISKYKKTESDGADWAVSRSRPTSSYIRLVQPRPQTIVLIDLLILCRGYM